MVHFEKLSFCSGGNLWGCYVVDVSICAGGRVFLFSWERLGKGLLENIVSGKAVPEVSDMKYKSELKHGFTDRGCLHCGILKLYTVSRKKEPTYLGIYNFSSKWDFQDFENA